VEGELELLSIASVAAVRPHDLSDADSLRNRWSRGIKSSVEAISGGQHGSTVERTRFDIFVTWHRAGVWAVEEYSEVERALLRQRQLHQHRRNNLPRNRSRRRGIPDCCRHQRARYLSIRRRPVRPYRPTMRTSLHESPWMRLVRRKPQLQPVRGWSVQSAMRRW
jgi:hypothetical protein